MINPPLCHTGTIVLHTERLVLRPFVLADSEAMYKNWASDEDVTRYLRWPPHGDVSVSEAVLSDWCARYEDPAYYQWAIVPTEIIGDAENVGEPIGSIGVISLDPVIGCAHIGYAIGRAWWHRGVTSEALAAVIDHLFDKVGMLRIESMHDPDNPHSGGVMQKCGMTYEGTRRCADFNNRGIVDACDYAILRREWETMRERKRKNLP
ncbi:MAG: GNAT family N-acetyltransferase [Clostridia bacterium]|nr:GNAT family N-acetyltransferase [Clostridia bacterium]